MVAADLLRLPTDLRPEQVTAVVDTREQTPLDLSPLRTVNGTLTTGDYSIRGLENVIAVERKSLPDLLSCIGTARKRFDREVQRLLAYPCRAIVVEATWPELEQGGWRSQVTPAAALGSVLGWIAAGVPIIMAGDRTRAGRAVSRLLFIAARRRWREARTLVRAAGPADGGRRVPTAAARLPVASPGLARHAALAGCRARPGEATGSREIEKSPSTDNNARGMGTRWGADGGRPVATEKSESGS